jgi:hypothetical protein
MLVKLYIYQDATIYNEVGITADNTLISADSTLITANQTFETIASTSRIAIPIDLFDDEVITLTSSIQNINDISKVFTDYTQSFTIPASKKNNETFRYWYENEIENGFNQLIRYDGYIEIDNEIFRVGKWQLESASVKQNKIENYKITFYGVLKSLTDKFGEDKLKDLQTLNDYTIEYSGTNVQDKITNGNDSNLVFPLISSNNVWQYGGGGAVQTNWDITNNATPIIYTELPPALKIARIFDSIETKYGVSFNGNFLTQTRFTDAYLWLKNKEAFAPMSENVLLNFSQTVNNLPNGFRGLYLQGDSFYVNTTQLLNEYIFEPLHRYIIDFSVGVNWKVTILKEGQPYSVNTGFGTSTGYFSLPLVQGTYKMYVSTSTSCTFTSVINSRTKRYSNPINFTVTGVKSGSTNSTLDLLNFMPDMKVSDFFSGVLKMFNLTAFSYDEENYTLEQLENWYFQGQIKDLTKYTITDLDFERIKPYKKMNFQFEKCESLMNRAFYDNNGQEYGNLTYSFNTDGADYTVKLPFENLLFNKFTGTNLQVAYAINKDLKPYQPKPIILYKTKYETGVSFKFNNGSTVNTITNYNVFGQDVYYQGEQHSLNFGFDLSSFFLYPINNGLFKDYYFNYLNNLYSVKSRLVKVSMRLPYSELLNLRLNDRIVIRDKRYVINQFTTNLKTFEVQMELIQDFRNINFNNSVPRIIDSSAQTLKFDTTSNEPLTWSILNDPDGQIITITNGADYVEVDTKQNYSGVEKIYSIESNNNDVIEITQNG